VTIRPDIPNLFIVDQPTNVWRGAQPTQAGFDRLKQDGITSIVKLNTEGEGSDDYAESIGMKVYRLPIPWWRQVLYRPDQSLLYAAAGFMLKGNCFVHCGSDFRTAHGDTDGKGEGGEDRTGLIVGCFRLAQGWTKAEAFEEAKAHNFHEILGGLMRAWTAQTEQQWQQWAAQHKDSP